MNTPRSSTETIIGALRILARDIQSEDGVANAAISEAADRLEEQAEWSSTLADAADKLIAENGMLQLKLSNTEAELERERYTTKRVMELSGRDIESLKAERDEQKQERECEHGAKLVMQRQYSEMAQQLAAEKAGHPYEQPLVDEPMDRQIVLLNRQVANLTKQLAEARKDSERLKDEIASLED